MDAIPLACSLGAYIILTSRTAEHVPSPLLLHKLVFESLFIGGVAFSLNFIIKHLRSFLRLIKPLLILENSCEITDN
ncbi:hypothetical protein M501DRAFT_1002221 [Patellaria atrata CBS 101060]|uniref:Uncharacterized protein n=1 Tax=Patellaria atrata CBS 101060 TaxID=1346257 RepID=A0A9P4S314_9PEZI|nr:hypothetical protein M501DRAFT_1002221 [Patellaria atrata CBS 101060]